MVHHDDDDDNDGGICSVPVHGIAYRLLIRRCNR
jgi:hypothetical protein